MAERSGEEMSAEDWAGAMGERWLANLDRFEGMIAPIGDAAIAAAGFAPGESVLDVGCGGGATSRVIARLVGPKGRVLGADISPALVEEARRRAAAEKQGNVEFRLVDAAKGALPAAAFDVLFSRFGVMFFEDPFAAFRNLRAAVRPGGRLAFACWAAPIENHWILSVIGALARHVELTPPAPRAPGPFAFAEADYVTEILGSAGFSDINVEAWRGDLLVGGAGLDAAAAADFVVNALSIGEIIRDKPQALREAVIADVAAAFRPFETVQGVATRAMSWIVSARVAH